jgi:tripartite-type tricarboxylate transporter receptor subunit TctC
MTDAKRSIPAVLLALACVALTSAAQAQDPSTGYPSKPLRLIVPFPPGGSTDIVARIVAQKLALRLGQSIVLENRGGAGGTLGATAAAKASPDGHTLLVGSTSTHCVAPSVYPKLDYDPMKDFAPVSMMATTPYLLVVNSAFSTKTLKEFIELAKAQPGRLNYASAGTGSTTHLAMEMLKSASNTFIVHIPYNGNGPAGTAIVAGQVEALFGSLPSVLPFVRSGKLRALAVGTLVRSPSLPEVPTVAESGYPGFEASLWLAVFAPAGTPASVLERLQKEMRAVVQAPDSADVIGKAGAEPVSSSPAELAAIVRDGIAKYAKVVKMADVKPE